MSRVVFVGNIPYNQTEEQLIEIFRTVGHVVGFRLVFDRESGKPRGYGFCEYLDHETAQSAVRNLNGKDVGGRPLRIDLADSDPLLEGRTTSHGELLDDRRRPAPPAPSTESWLTGLPQGSRPPPGKSSTDVITDVLASIRPEQVYDVLRDMKTFIQQHSDRARILLVANPQLAYALFQAGLLHNVIDPSAIHRVTEVPRPTPTPTPAPAPAPAPPAVLHYPLAGQSQPSSSFYPQPPTHTPTPAPAMPTVQQGIMNLDAEKQALLIQVISMTPEQLMAIPPQDRLQIQTVRASLGLPPIQLPGA